MMTKIYSATYVFKLGPKGLKWIIKKETKKWVILFSRQKKKEIWKIYDMNAIGNCLREEITEAHTAEEIQTMK